MLLKLNFMKKQTSKEAAETSFTPMALVNPHAAGIDMGDTLHAVAVPIDRDEQPVQITERFILVVSDNK